VLFGPLHSGLLAGMQLELAQGRSNEEIGRVLFIGHGTVKTHVTHILTKLGLRDGYKLSYSPMKPDWSAAAFPTGDRC
jgi:DNA-binding NarL/FixJ family response regulator